MKMKLAIIFAIFSIAHAIPLNYIDEVLPDPQEKYSSIENEVLDNEISSRSAFYDAEEEARELKELDNSVKFQGDILKSKNSEDSGDFDLRTGTTDERLRWPKNKKGNVIVPYEFDPTGYSKFSKVNEIFFKTFILKCL